jgi:hypothetical protein
MCGGGSLTATVSTFALACYLGNQGMLSNQSSRLFASKFGVDGFSRLGCRPCAAYAAYVDHQRCFGKKKSFQRKKDAIYLC